MVEMKKVGGKSLDNVNFMMRVCRYRKIQGSKSCMREILKFR